MTSKTPYQAKQSAVLLLIIMAVTACDKGGGGSSGGFCPSRADNITFNSYGTFQLEDAGRDATARQLVSDCDWQIHDNRNGGTGNTLQVTTSGIIFVWAFNSFHGFVLSQGWTGQTHGGIRLGATVSQLQQAHSGFVPVSDQVYRYSQNGDSVRATFDAQGRLVELYVGRFYRPAR